jgi:hypothetical protein
MNAVFMIPKPATIDPLWYSRTYKLRREIIKYPQCLNLWGFRTPWVGSVVRSRPVYGCLAFSQCCKTPNGVAMISLLSFPHDGLTTHWIVSSAPLWLLTQASWPTIRWTSIPYSWVNHTTIPTWTLIQATCHMVTTNQST